MVVATSMTRVVDLIAFVDRPLLDSKNQEVHPFQESPQIDLRGSATLDNYRAHRFVMPLAALTGATVFPGWFGVAIGTALGFYALLSFVGARRARIVINGNTVVVQNAIHSYGFDARNLTLYSGGGLFAPHRAAVLLDDDGTFAVSTGVSKGYEAFQELSEELLRLGGKVEDTPVTRSEQARQRLWFGSKSRRLPRGK